VCYDTMYWCQFNTTDITMGLILRLIALIQGVTDTEGQFLYKLATVLVSMVTNREVTFSI